MWLRVVGMEVGMRKSLWLIAFLSIATMVGVTVSKADPVASPWQEVITAQVEAFRADDGAAALGFAAAAFEANFADPAQFLAAIRNSGYGAIMDSRSHSFGEFQMINADVVLQAVTFTGPDQMLYRATYQMEHEADGWRVGAVDLQKTEAIGV
jgi:ketosteroid isomerase-like protein